MLQASPMRGLRFLVLEDEYHLAVEYERLLLEQGAEVVGPVGDLGSALRLIETCGPIDAAILDINIYGSTVFPVAHELKRRGVPFLFATGYQSIDVPPDFDDVPVCLKPLDASDLLGRLPTRPAAGGQQAVGATRGADNRLLAAFPAEVRARLEAAGDLVAVAAGKILVEPDEPIEFMHFPMDGLFSVDTVDGRGARAMSALVGREGAVEIGALVGVRSVAQMVAVRVGGAALRVPAERGARLIATDDEARDAFMRYAHSLYLQASSNALASARHTLDCRLARLFLMVQDRLGAADLPLTHASLAEMLGTRRSGVTEAVHMLESVGVIRATRANIRVVDRPGLVRASCGSYG